MYEALVVSLILRIINIPLVAYNLDSFIHVSRLVEILVSNLVHPLIEDEGVTEEICMNLDDGIGFFIM